MTDFSINAVATSSLLEKTRIFAKDAVFIFTSTNKVYGDNPNLLPFVEEKPVRITNELQKVIRCIRG